MLRKWRHIGIGMIGAKAGKEHDGVTITPRMIVRSCKMRLRKLEECTQRLDRQQAQMRRRDASRCKQTDIPID